MLTLITITTAELKIIFFRKVALLHILQSIISSNRDSRFISLKIIKLNGIKWNKYEILSGKVIKHNPDFIRQQKKELEKSG